MGKQKIELYEVKEKETKAGKKMWTASTDIGPMSVFNEELAETLSEEGVGKICEVETITKGQYTNIVDFTDTFGEIDQKDATIFGNRKINRNNRNINPEYIVNIQGKEFITANGLLAIAQEEGGIEKMEILNIEANFEKKWAYATVRITMRDRRIFENIGSATQDNLKPNMQKNFIEMAVTRAQSRALRMGLNVDYCSAEEV